MEGQAPEDRLIRPSMKTVYAAYVLALLVIAACAWGYFEYADDKPRWLLAIPLIVLLPPLRMHLSRRLVTVRLHDDHLTLETGLLSRTRRTVDMAKIQDVTVRQTLGQRMMGIGDLTLESAGESGRIALQNFDNPRGIADAIIDCSKRLRGSGLNPGLHGGLA
jgi:membrane protein YdbS with pleckstrin-like domain